MTKKITDLVAAGPIIGTEVLPIVQAGVTKRTSIDTMKADVLPSGDTSGVTDSAAIIAALAAAAPTFRPVLLAPGRFYCRGVIQVPDAVSFRGCGTGDSTKTTPTGATTLVAADAAFSLRFGERLVAHRASWSGGFEIDGANIATQPLYMGQVVDCFFSNIRVVRAAGTGWLLESGQNNVFIKVVSSQHTGSALVVDSGAGGNLFLGCNLRRSGSATNPLLLITETFNDGPYGASGPSQNVWDNCLFEEFMAADQLTLTRYAKGTNNRFEGCIWSAGTGAPAGIILLDVPSGSGLFRVNNSSFSGAGATAIRAGSGNGRILFGGLTRFINLNVAVEVIGNSFIDFDHVDLAQVTTWTVDNGGGQNNALRARYRTPIQVDRNSTSDAAFVAQVTGDTVQRYRVRSDGRTFWGGGTATEDVELFRSAADILATNDDFAVTLAGKGLRVKEGTNAKQGVATLAAGTVTVANTSVTASSRILLTPQTLSGVLRPQALGITARTAGTSFTVTSADPTDTSTFAYEIIEPA